MNWLILADQSPEGIHDPGCLKLAGLHSDAVDYPKSGNPVAQSDIPRLRFREKPDWSAPETVSPDSSKYYVSQRAIGQLFRDIDLPPLARTHHRREVLEVSEALDRLSFGQDLIVDTIESRVGEFLDIQDIQDNRSPSSTSQYINQIFDRYVSELRVICVANALSHRRSASLTEEEAMIGTIVQKSSQQRKRRDMMSKLREQTDILVRGVREELAGDNDMLPTAHLERAWLAWQRSISEGESFGGKSFGWVALGAVFEAIKEIEESE
jgi:RNA-dependent RNA polymerase